MTRNNPATTADDTNALPHHGIPGLDEATEQIAVQTYAQLIDNAETLADAVEGAIETGRTFSLMTFRPGRGPAPADLAAYMPEQARIAVEITMAVEALDRRGIEVDARYIAMPEAHDLRGVWAIGPVETEVDR